MAARYGVQVRVLSEFTCRWSCVYALFKDFEAAKVIRF